MIDFSQCGQPVPISKNREGGQMVRLAALLVSGIFMLGMFYLSGCQSVEKAGEEIRQDFKLGTDEAYPQGREAEIERRGEP